MARRTPGTQGSPLVSSSSSGGASITSMTLAAFNTETTSGTAHGSTGYTSIYLTDGLYECYWNGSAWEYYSAGYKCTRPLAATYSTAHNAGSSTLTDTGAGMLFTFASGSSNIRGYYKTPPVTPYSIIAMLKVTLQPGTNSRGGIALRESATGKIVTLGLAMDSANMKVDRWSGTGTFSASPFIQTNNEVGHWFWWKITNSGTTLSYQYSVDGVNFIQLGSESVTAYFTTAPDLAGVAIYDGSGQAMLMSVQSLLIA